MAASTPHINDFNGVFLNAGSHTLYFFAREINTEIDSIEITNDPNYVPNWLVEECPKSDESYETTSSQDYVYIKKEAESGLVVGNFFEIKSDNSYSNCSYINSIASPYNQQNWGNKVLYNFEVSKDDYYYFWVRTKGSGWNSDSFFVQIDDIFSQPFYVSVEHDIKWKKIDFIDQVTTTVTTSDGRVTTTRASSTVATTSDGRVTTTRASSTVATTSGGRVTTTRASSTVATTSGGRVTTTRASSTVATTSDGRVTTTRASSTVATTSDGRVTTTSTTISEISNMIVYLKGDYDMSFEYTSLFINQEKNEDLCKDCKINCNTPQPEFVIEKPINIDKYCSDESGGGFIEFLFVDSLQANECPPQYKVCLNITNKKYCCEKTCDDDDCKNYVAFDCDTWGCVDLKNIMIKNFLCSKTSGNKIKCDFNVARNKIDNKTDIVILLFDEENGKIYYISREQMNEKYIGRKTLYMEKISDCEDKTLQIVLNIFNKNKLIYNKNFGEFRC